MFSFQRSLCGAIKPRANNIFPYKHTRCATCTWWKMCWKNCWRAVRKSYGWNVYLSLHTLWYAMLCFAMLCSTVRGIRYVHRFNNNNTIIEIKPRINHSIISMEKHVMPLFPLNICIPKPSHSHSHYNTAYTIKHNTADLNCSEFELVLYILMLYWWLFRVILNIFIVAWYNLYDWVVHEW